MPIPTGTVSRTTSQALVAERAHDAEGADQRQPYRHRAPRSEAGREIGGDGSEEAHAEDGDRAEQPDERVGRVEVVLDVVDQRTDADDLRAQCERGEEQPRERGAGRPCRQRSVIPARRARLRAMRANASTCFRASRPAAPGLRDRIASSSGTCSSAASSGSTYVP